MLRVGVIIDSLTTTAWVLRVIQEIQSSKIARTELIALKAPGSASPSFLINPRSRPSSILFRMYERWDYKRNISNRDALASCDLSRLIEDIPTISIQPIQEGSEDTIAEAQVAEIGRHNLDVLLRFGLHPLQGEVLKAARYGVWSVSPDETSSDYRGPALFWELFDRSPVSPSRLLIQTHTHPAGAVALQGYAATDQASLYRTRNPVYWKSAELVLRGLREADTHGARFLQSLPDRVENDSSRRRTFNTIYVLRFMALELCRWLKARIASARSGAPAKWVIAIRPRSQTRLFDDPSHYSMMRSPPDRFYADPFLFHKNGRTYLFFEDFRYTEGRAIISCCELAADGTPGPPHEVLRRPYHLSYPFLFEDEGQIYMIPETRGNRTIELYRSVEFPSTWVFEETLFSDIYAVDATIQRIDGTLWMFTSLSNGDYSNSDELSLFSAPALKGPWKPHPCNPVISDVQRARPAGMLFYDNGRLIRPSQDCGKAYGYALVFSEIVTLTETDYRERPISRLNPEPVAHALANHTYNRTEHFEVIDRTLPARVANNPGA